MSRVVHGHGLGGQASERDEGLREQRVKAGGNGQDKSNSGRCLVGAVRRWAQERAEARREQVLAAAEECFRSHGFHNTSMAQISKSAQMSPGHIYHYFENKEDIIRAIVQMDLEDTLAIIRENANQGGDLLEAMLSGVDDGVRRMSSPGKAAITLEVISEAAHNPRVAEMVREMDARLRREIREMLIRGRRSRGLSTSEADLDAKVEVMSAIFDGLAMRAVSNPKSDVTDLTRVVKDALNHIASS
ncbi:MAG: TetR/AcrR family transcriptional regulator [Desulfarculus sp.]|nr:TetR/AcrR family transcriptional regulator [Desulfarculus sp.]